MTNVMIKLIDAEAQSYEATLAGDPSVPLHSENIDGLPSDIWRTIATELQDNDAYATALADEMDRHGIMHRSTRRTQCQCGWFGYQSQYRHHVGRKLIFALTRSINTSESHCGHV